MIALTWLTTCQYRLTVAFAAAALVFATLFAWKCASCARTFSFEITVPHVLQASTQYMVTSRGSPSRLHIPSGDSGTPECSRRRQQQRQCDRSVHVGGVSSL